jgi:hypothetical protein
MKLYIKAKLKMEIFKEKFKKKEKIMFFQVFTMKEKRNMES